MEKEKNVTDVTEIPNELIDEILERFYLAPEEEQAYAEEQKRKQVEMGYLLSPKEYSSEFQTPQETVEKEAERFIMPECLPACKELWKKNIYTYMVSDHLNEGECWIEVELDALSDENKDVYMQLDCEDITKFSYHYKTLNFGVKCVGLEAQQKLLFLAKQFKMQDVQLENAYLLPETFLMRYCGCYEEYDNPDYKYMTPPWEDNTISIEEQIEQTKKYTEWEISINSVKRLRKFAPEKVTKPIEEYAKEHNMIYEDGRVYFSKFHYDKHKNYINYINDIEKQGGNHHI